MSTAKDSQWDIMISRLKKLQQQIYQEQLRLENQKCFTEELTKLYEDKLKKVEAEKNEILSVFKLIAHAHEGPVQHRDMAYEILTKYTDYPEYNHAKSIS